MAMLAFTSSTGQSQKGQIILARGGSNCPVNYGCPAPPPPSPGGGSNGGGNSGGGRSSGGGTGLA